MKTRRKGNIIAIALVVMFCVVTLLLALFQVTSMTWSETMRTEAELETQQLVKFKLFETLRSQTSPDVSRLGIKIEVQSDERSQRSQTSSLLFQKGADGWTGLPNVHEGKPLSFDGSQNGFLGHRYFDFKVRSGGPRMEFGAVTGQSLPFALMSCSSAADAIVVDRLVAWKNPGWGEAEQPLQEYSSTAPSVLAPGKVTIKDMPYGSVLTATPASLRSTSGAGAVAYQIANLDQGNFPNSPTQIAVLLRQQLQNARQSIVAAAQNSDKSILFNDNMSEADSLGLFFTSHALSQKFEDRLSVRQSQSFWLPTVPSFTKQFFVIYHLILHVPDAPDGGLSGVARDAQSVLTELINLVHQLDKATEGLEVAKSAVQSARDWLDEHMNCGNCDYPWNWPCCAAREIAKGALYVAEGGLYAAEEGVTLLEQAIMVVISPITDALEAILLGSGQMPVPSTRKDEKNYQQMTGAKIDAKGMDFWAYRSVFDGIGHMVVDLVSGNFNKVAQDFGHPVSLVFFGQQEKKQSWNFSNGIATRASLNVPAGRSLVLNSSVNIAGDVWLGRGSTLIVHGDLVLQAGDTPTGGGTAPSGRILIEEGANLSVTGSVTCAGTLQTGSVVVSGPVGKLHQISSSIFCGGDFNAPFGVLPGASADELAVVSKGQAAQKTAAATQLWGPILQSMGANLAKIKGPFFRRFPPIARYATTFEIITLEGPIPFVIPEEFGNLLVPVCRGLSALYAPTLNFEVGENFMTHCDWWGSGGEGRAPVFVKPTAVALANALGAGGTWDPQLSVNFSSALAIRKDQVASGQVDRFSNHLCIALASEWSKAIILGTGVPLVSFGKIISKVLDVIDKDYYSVATREQELDAIIPDASVSALTNQMNRFWGTFNSLSTRPDSELPQECPGVLIYAGGQIVVGTSAQNAKLASGWFVAESSISLYCDTTVGAASSLGSGKLKASNFYFYPNFTKASLWIPNSEDADWRTRGVVSTYAQDDSRTMTSKSVDIGLGETITWFGMGKMR